MKNDSVNFGIGDYDPYVHKCGYVRFFADFQDTEENRARFEAALQEFTNHLKALADKYDDIHVRFAEG